MGVAETNPTINYLEVDKGLKTCILSMELSRIGVY